LPLRAAYPSRKRGLADRFLQNIRDLYLIPAAQGPDRTRRIHALALLYAAQDNALGAQVKENREACATQLEMPARIVDDYLARSEKAWSGSVTPPAATNGEVSLDDWQRWLDDVDAKLQRDKISKAELDDLQKRGQALSESVQGALEVRGLETTVKLLEEQRGAE